MRSRFLLLLLGAALVVVFALLNWAEFRRPVPVNLAWGVASAPLSLILLGLLALAVLSALASGAAQRSRHARLEREQARALQTQRELAERAEASRFIDLRQMLDTHLRETRQREAANAAQLDQAMARSQREVRTQLEQLHRALSSRLGEMEARLEARWGHEAALARPVAPPAAEPLPREAVRAPAQASRST